MMYHLRRSWQERSMFDTTGEMSTFHLVNSVDLSIEMSHVRPEVLKVLTTCVHDAVSGAGSGLRIASTPLTTGARRRIPFPMQA